MSDCRFSSMNWKCELYVYEAREGVVIHVTDARLKDGIVPHPELGGYPVEGTEEEKKEWFRKDRENLEIFETLGKENCYDTINTPSAGKMFSRMSHARAALVLQELKDEGFIFPDYVIEDYRDAVGNPDMEESYDGDEEDARAAYEETLLSGARKTLTGLSDREDMLADRPGRGKDSRMSIAAKNKALLSEAIRAVDACIDGWDYAQ